MPVARAARDPMRRTRVMPRSATGRRQGLLVVPCARRGQTRHVDAAALVRSLERAAIDAAPAADDRPRLAALSTLPARRARTVPLPQDLPEALRQRLTLAGVEALWSHQAEALAHVRAATYDGDTPRGERDAVRRTANVLLTNPDMLHVGILPAHRRWGDFLHRLALVVVDECHVARGVFGSHVAAILRRLRRICERYGAAPTFVLTSATSSPVRALAC